MRFELVIYMPKCEKLRQSIVDILLSEGYYTADNIHILDTVSTIFIRPNDKTLGYNMEIGAAEAYAECESTPALDMRGLSI